jgi:hypothetical protein
VCYSYGCDRNSKPNFIYRRGHCLTWRNWRSNAVVVGSARGEKSLAAISGRRSWHRRLRGEEDAGEVSHGKKESLAL